MDFLSQALEILTPDTFINILMTMPGPSVLSLCLTDKKFNNFCNLYNDRIFLQLSVRDYEPYLGDKGTNSWKQFYLKKLTVLGQPYILDFNYDSKKICKTTIGNTAKIISGNYWENPKNKVRFNLGRLLDYDIFRRREVVEGDFKRGKKYWINVAVSKEGRYYVKIFQDFKSALNRAITFIKVSPNINNLDNLFPFDSEWFHPNSLHKSFEIFFKKHERLCYVPKPGVTNMLIIKEIVLE